MDADAEVPDRERANLDRGSSPPEIGERAFQFAARVLRLVRTLPRDTAGSVVARQLAKCATSVGANIEEAKDAQSKREYARKLSIARGEARETLYWLRLIGEVELAKREQLAGLISEADEILRILVTIVKRLRQE